MKNEAIYNVHVAAHNFMLFFHERPRWQQQIIRSCLGYKACYFLEMLDRALDAYAVAQ